MDPLERVLQHGEILLRWNLAHEINQVVKRCILPVGPQWTEPEGRFLGVKQQPA